ncbi:dehydratase [Alicyclobacillaceae bacterium I2511]|nr:dehydratase [Alicyclobacillaceae bacterium I2511]
MSPNTFPPDGGSPLSSPRLKSGASRGHLVNEKYVQGQVLGPLVKPPITRIQLVRYAGASGDFNPIHTVAEFALAAGLGGVIAHGMLTMGFVGQLLTDIMGPQGRMESFSVRFKEMVHPGDVLTCQGRVSSSEQVPEGNRVHCEVWATQQEGKQVVTGKASFFVPNAQLQK